MREILVTLLLHHLNSSPHFLSLHQTLHSSTLQQQGWQAGLLGVENLTRLYRSRQIWKYWVVRGKTQVQRWERAFWVKGTPSTQFLRQNCVQCVRGIERRRCSYNFLSKGRIGNEVRKEAKFFIWFHRTLHDEKSGVWLLSPIKCKSLWLR